MGLLESIRKIPQAVWEWGIKPVSLSARGVSLDEDLPILELKKIVEDNEQPKRILGARGAAVIIGLVGSIAALSDPILFHKYPMLMNTAEAVEFGYLLYFIVDYSIAYTRISTARVSLDMERLIPESLRQELDADFEKIQATNRRAPNLKD